jgi:hypothetical protein
MPPTLTEQVIAGMLTEPTGRHMLDSGDAYGRHWQRNAGMTAESFAERPTASWGWRGEYVIVDLYHWLTERLSFAEELDAEFQRFAEQRPDDGWLSIAEEFAEQRWSEAERSTINTCNGEDSLSQTIQYVLVLDHAAGEEYVILQIHGGCDLRGGYTQPRVFAVIGDEYCMYENADFAAGCTGLIPPQAETLPGFPDSEVQYHYWYQRYGELFTDDGGNADADFSETWDEEAETVMCPACLAAGQRNPVTPYIH